MVKRIQKLPIYWFVWLVWAGMFFFVSPTWFMEPEPRAFFIFIGSIISVMAHVCNKDLGFWGGDE